MKRTHLNFVVDAVAFVMFVFMVVTGVIMEFLLPAGSGHSTTLWGLDRHGWGDVHFWLSVVFLTALALHVYLHWKWIYAVLRGRPREGSGVRLGLGLLGLTALLAIAVAPILTPVKRSEASRAGPPTAREIDHDEHEFLPEGSAEVRGSMTLGEIMELGVPHQTLVRELGLPAGTPASERLGRLGRAYGFPLTEVRDLVESHR